MRSIRILATLLVFCPVVLWAQTEPSNVAIDSVSFCVDASGFAADGRISGAQNVDVTFLLGADSSPLTAPTQRFSVAFSFGETTLITSPPVIETLGSPPLNRWQDGPVQDADLVPLAPGAWSVRGRAAHGADPFQPGDTIWGLLIQVDGEPDRESGPIPVQICAADGTAPPAVDDVINLNGAPGTSVTHEFAVTEVGFPISLAAETGSVAPAELTEPGNATYTRAIPESAEVDTILQDTITLTDADGITRLIAVNVEVTAPAQRDITDIPFLTPNQRALAVWVDDACPRLQDRGAQNALEEDLLDICGRLRDPDNLDTQVADALDAINPDQWMAATTVALRLTRVQHGNLAQRINSLRSGATGLDTSGLNVHVHGLPVPQEVAAELLRSMLGGGASADDLIGGEDFGRWGLFANGNINFGDQSRTANQAGFDFNTLGITAGIDYRLRDNLFLGAAVGYANVDVDFARAGGDMDVDSWNLSLFGTWFQTDRYYVDALVNYGRNDYDSKRHIRFSDAQGLFERTAIGDANGKQLSASLAAGYDFGRGPWTFGPHAGTDYLDVDIGRVREQGAGALNMIVGRQSAKSLTLNAGGHASYVYAATWGVFIPHLRLDYVRELETDRHLMDVRLAADPFANDPSNPSPTITLQSDRPDPSYFVWSIGASAQFVNGIAGFVNYQHMSGMNDFTLSQVNYGLRFERRF
jgi:outer membrane autotransporter protein